MKDKKKRLLVVAGGGILALALILAIAGQFHTDTPAEDVLSSSGATDSKISSAPEVNVPEQDESAVSVLLEDTDSEASADSMPTQTDQSEQSIQPDVSKPAAPEKPKVDNDADITNPKQPPTYSPENTEKETGTEPSKSTPQGGDTQDGKVYLPGFGWVTDTGGTGSTADDMYENGNKIGEMN